MKILYGVQGTGNGHISRARSMATHFNSKNGVEIDWLFSGRSEEKYFGMDVFENCTFKKGMTFDAKNGTVNKLGTVFKNNYFRFLKDVISLDTKKYDLIVTDYEPITAWAGLLSRKPVISLGHQSAFDYDIPLADADAFSMFLLKYFAPGNIRVGLHWNKFDAPILPPIIDKSQATEKIKHKVIVYLPFEDLETISMFLSPIQDYEFYIYHPEAEDKNVYHLHFRKPSKEGFVNDMANCYAVICNAGFELSSEALSLGKRLLVKPVKNQMEQSSNAKALLELGYGNVISKLSSGYIERWLKKDTVPIEISFPDVAESLTNWIIEKDYSPESLEYLSVKLWNQTFIIRNI